ncbi:unnamed protein product [Cuscuta campestris]|uniref:Cytochrome P450 n=1 Tax=Cuscuta campestris TaxID=132261 RepID=A0A484K977_9ASTE|nr:unnamed protein product [Cuscuta campestris]
MKVADYIMYGKKDVLFGQYGPLWREMRKLFIVELLSSHKVSSFESLRREELRLLVESLKRSEAGAAVDLSAKVASMVENMTCRMLFGRKYDAAVAAAGAMVEKGGFKAVIDEAAHLASVPNLGDYFPILGKLDVQGLVRKAKVVKNLFDQFFEMILEEHEHKRVPIMDDEHEEEEEDFVDIILGIFKNRETSFEFTRQHVKSIMLDLVVASVDTSTTLILWTMSELIKNPTIMKKVKEELGRQVGFGRVVEEKDLEHLKYLEMVIKESLRMHPVVPLLLPHAAIEDCTVGDFHVPKNAKLVVNVWAIARDPNVWVDPDSFVPERFEGSNVDYRGRHFELIPFGSGRRSCPGLQLGITTVRLVVAQLAHCFDWDLPNPTNADATRSQDLDMTEEYGLTLNRAHHLMAVPSYKLLV